MIQVSTGDGVQLEVFARYSTGMGSNNALISNLASVVTGSFGLTSGEAAHTALTNNVPPQAATIGQTAGVPKAYLFYILFNSSYVYQQFGYVAVNNTALVGHQQMYLDITVPTGGYLYTYVANEANVSAATSVYFDDFTIVHTRNTPTLQVLQTNDYFPFGLQIAASSYQKQTSLDNDYLYNGKELQDEHNLGWLDYGARMYDNTIGRWHVIDPFTERMANFSTYAYTFNNPILFIDPSGMLPTYNWGSGNYENEDGEIISWQEAYESIKKGAGPPKRHAMIFMNNGKQLLAMAADDKINQNWHYYNATNLEDASEHVKTYSSEVGRLVSLVIRSHGALATIALGLPEEASRCNPSDCFSRDDASLMESGFEPDSPIGDGATFNALKAFSSVMADGGSLVFTACNGGAYAGELGTRINKILKQSGVGVNFNMYFNADQSRMRKHLPNGETRILNYSLTAKGDFRNGWYLIAPDGSPTQLMKSLQLNSSGTPITFVDPD